MSLKEPDIPKSMSDPSLMIGNGFKNDSAILLMPFEMFMPCYRVVLPTTNHSINQTYWKATIFVVIQKPS
jgi:hypothetical protein